MPVAGEDSWLGNRIGAGRYGGHANNLGRLFGTRTARKVTGCMTEFFVDDERRLVRAPHQGEASWTAVVLYRFWVARTVPASRVAGKGDLTTDFTEDHGLRCRGSSPGRFALPFPVPSAVGRSVSLSRGLQRFRKVAEVLRPSWLTAGCSSIFGKAGIFVFACQRCANGYLSPISG